MGVPDARVTLVEIAVVIAMIGIVAMLAVPNIMGVIPRMQLASDTTTLANTIAMACFATFLTVLYALRYGFRDAGLVGALIAVSRQFAGGAVMAATSVTREAQQQFIALAIPQAVPVSATPTDTNAGAGDDIRIEVHRGALQISGSWPQAAAADCAGWLRELLKRSAWTQFGWPPNPLTCARAPTAYWLRWCRFSALRRRTTTTCSPTRAARSSSCGCTTASASGAPRGARTRGRNQGRIQWPAAGSWDSLTLSVIAG